MDLLIEYNDLAIILILKCKRWLGSTLAIDFQVMNLKFELCNIFDV